MTEPTLPDAPGAPVAIVGLACRFGEANGPLALFDSALAGRRAFRRLPTAGRADLATAEGSALPRAGLIEGWEFRRADFGLSERAFRAGNPALWLALETSGHALADAGFPDGRGLGKDRAGVVMATRKAAELADRICGQFGLRGGGRALHATQSSSLFAVATACSLLAVGDLDFVLAGGVDIVADLPDQDRPGAGGIFATGQVRIYDASPTGSLPGEGCGVLALMRAADAAAADMPVYAEISGWGAASAGNREIGAADAASQVLAMRRACLRAGVDPADIQVIEGDGFGTADADLAELTALRAIRDGAATPAALGSVKANIGHTGAAAGVAGLIKAGLAVNAGVIPPATGSTDPHPLVAAQGSSLRLPDAARSWPPGTRLAAVNSVDRGGSAVHVVLRRESSHAAPLQQATGGTRRIGTWSVRDRQRGDTYPFAGGDRASVAVELARVAQAAPGLSDGELGDLACQLGRQPAAGPVRVAIAAGTQEELARRAGEAATLLPGLAKGELTARPHVFAADGAGGRVALLLPGEAVPVIPPAATAPAGPAPARPAAGAPATPAPAASQRTIVSRTLDALRWLDKLGVRAGVAVGYGLGEITGLVWAGFLSEPDAAQLVAQREALLAAPAARRTAMVCVLADAVTAQGLCVGTDLVVSAYCGPRCHVLSGSAEAARDTLRRAERAAVEAFVLSLPLGLHSPALADRIAPMRNALADVEFSPPRRRLISTITGADLTDEAGIAALLARQLTAPVRFAEALSVAAKDADLLIDAGPGRGMAALAAQSSDAPAVSLAPEDDDGMARASVAAALYAAGALVSLAPVLTGRPSRPIDISRERVYISSPRQARETVSQVRATELTSPGGLGHGPALGAARRDPDVLDAAAPPDPEQFYPGIGTWVRCFAEQLRPPRAGVVEAEEEPWRLYATTRQPFGRMAAEVFEDDPSAPGVLAVIGDAADPHGGVTLVAAANEAIEAGSLVVITPSAGLGGFCASLHAEHPCLGITLLRTADSTDGLIAAQRFAVTTPGEFRELVLADDGTPAEPVMLAAAPGASDGPWPSPCPDDVLVISATSAQDGLAGARLLASCGARMVVLGPAGRDDLALIEHDLRQLQAAGVSVTHVQADIADPDETEIAVHGIEQQIGAVTGLVHLAGTGPLRGCASLTEQDLRAQLSAQVDGFTNVLGAVGAAGLRLLVTLGPLAGRYGAAGRCVPALAATALSEQAQRLRPGLSRCRVVHADGPWAQGSAAEGHGEVARALLGLLASPHGPARAAIHGRLSHPLPAPIAAGAELARPAASGRFLESLPVHYPGVEAVAEAGISPVTDPYLADNLVDGGPVMPAAMGLEAMAQVASLLAGRPLRHLKDVSMDEPVAVPAAGGQRTVRVCALVRDGAVETVLHSSGSGFRIDHLRAIFPLVPPAAGNSQSLPDWAAEPGSLPAVSGIVDGTDLYGHICFQSGRLRRVAFLPDVTSRTCRALVRGSDDRPWFGALPGPVDAPLILGSPGLADATTHVLQACLPHRRVVPESCDEVTFRGREVRGAAAVHAQRRPGTQGVWDVVASDATGLAIVAWTGLRLREAGPLANPAPWHPALLAASVEGRAAELGLDPALSVMVHSGRVGRGSDEPADATMWADTCPGTGPLDGFELNVRASVPVAGRWEAVGLAPQPAGGEQVALARQLRAHTGEPAATVAARFLAIAACLEAAGRDAGSARILEEDHDGGWIRLTAANAALACTVTEIGGVPQPVAIAIATWPPGTDGPRRALAHAAVSTVHAESSGSGR